MRTLIIIAVALIIVWLVSKVAKNWSNVKVMGGSAPTQADKDCASGGRSTIIGSCTKPVIYPIVKPMKEKCFTSQELGGIEEGGTAPAIVTELGGFGTTWYLNYQAGDRFCYRSPQFYK